MKKSLLAIAMMLVATIASAQGFHSAVQTATWTSATALNTRLNLSIYNYTSVAVSYVGTTTLTAGAITFEVSDDFGTTFYPATMARTDVFQAESVFTAVVGTQAWRRNAAAFTTFSVRLSTAITGTGSVTITEQAVSSANSSQEVVGQTQFNVLNGRMSLDNANHFVCTLTTAATTSTLITGCAGVAGTYRYVTDVAMYGGVATGATAAATVQSGTGGTCGTGTTVLHYCQHAATAGCEHTFATAARGVLAGEICILDATVGTKFVTVSGYTSTVP